MGSLPQRHGGPLAAVRRLFGMDDGEVQTAVRLARRESVCRRAQADQVIDAATATDNAVRAGRPSLAWEDILALPRECVELGGLHER